jgi:hypothetical protein
MTAPTTWPDRVAFEQAIMTHARSFVDPDLRTATFDRDKFSQPISWSGGRAIVFRATCRSGRVTAVRFLMHDDLEASVRYHALSRHLSATPVRCLVAARWIAEGVQIGAGRYPMLTMDWVDGVTLDRYLDRVASRDCAAAELRTLAELWRSSCRTMADAEVGHGDVHAGNLLVAAKPGAAPAIFLVDYDNIWVPGLHVPFKEIGNPAFQHPRRTGPCGGRNADAFPATLVYLSLLHLANDPGSWNRVRGDDRLIFAKDDLSDTGREIWTELERSPEAQVRLLTAVTKRWLTDGPPDAFPTLEDVLREADRKVLSERAAPPGRRNVWPPLSARETPESRSGPERAMANRADGAVPRLHQAWPPAAPPRPPAEPRTGRSNHAVAWLAALLLLAAIIAFLSLR